MNPPFFSREQEYGPLPGYPDVMLHPLEMNPLRSMAIWDDESNDYVKWGDVVPDFTCPLCFCEHWWSGIRLPPEMLPARPYELATYGFAVNQ